LSAPKPLSPLTREPFTNDDDRASLESYSVKDLARLTGRHESTIRNFVSKYQIPYRMSWETFRRHHRRVMRFRKDRARFVVEVMLYKMRPVNLSR
jgi:hypothetical protein